MPVSDRRAFDPHTVVNTFRTRVPGPVGCLLLVLLSPLLLIGLVVGLFVLRRKTHALRRAFEQQPRTPEDIAREVALCSLVRGLALEPRFSRDDALATPVMTGDRGAPPTSELLDEAVRRGWIRGSDQALHVTDTGRAESDRFLDRARM